MAFSQMWKLSCCQTSGATTTVVVVDLVDGLVDELDPVEGVVFEPDPVDGTVDNPETAGEIDEITIDGLVVGNTDVDGELEC